VVNCALFALLIRLSLKYEGELSFSYEAKYIEVHQTRKLYLIHVKRMDIDLVKWLSASLSASRHVYEAILGLRRVLSMS
jgi:hypothetical protein